MTSTADSLTWLQGLNEPQRQAVTAPPGPVLVLAGPGSGKTRVLTYRIAYLIRELRIPPWHILAVTFTNKAAREMRHRIEKLLESQQRGLHMGTFHATCAVILRREAAQLTGYTRDFVIFDTDDQQQVVKQALQELNLDEKRFPPGKMLAGIGQAKNELVTPELYAASNYIAEVTKRVYTRYQALLQANNAMDFDDLLLNTVRLFDEQPEVLRRYQERYQHLLVDEFQDTNTAQYALLIRLAAAHHNIFVVGDSDQSIYKWRGADFRNLQRFREQYPAAQQILLEQNYRSTQLILDAAKAVIQHNRDRVHKDLFTTRRGGEKITVRELYNEGEEARQVVDVIAHLVLEGYDPGDFAVMYRTNAQSRVIEEAFLRAGLPYRLVGATRFYGRREIKDIIAYLRLVHNPRDEVSFNRVVNTPTRGIGAKTREQLTAWARQAGLSPAEALLTLVSRPEQDHPFRGRIWTSLLGLGNLLHNWMAAREQAPVGALLDRVLQDVDFRNYLDDGTDEGRDRWANVLELRGVAQAAEGVALAEFLEQVALVSEVDNLEEGVRAPTLLTLHAAKGLEFPVVFITGLEEGLLPHSRALEDAEEMAEERRLFYVGLTRARDRLYLTHTFRRNLYGLSDTAAPSRFLQDIPERLVDGRIARRPEAKQQVSQWNWSPSLKREAPALPQRSAPTTPPPPAARPAASSPPLVERPARPAAPRYKTGQTVRHAHFGPGIVIESKITGNDEEVTVAFKEVGIKRLAASFANLEVVG